MKKGKENVVETKPVATPVVVAPVKPQKRIAIVGCSDSKTSAPYNDASWEIWAMNNAYAHVPVSTRNVWFEIHPIKKMPDGRYMRRKLIKPGIFEWAYDFRGQNMDDYMRSLAALDCAVYMQQHWDIIPKSVAYPLNDITKKFGRYFTNSVSYMIALAIHQGATEIGCWGVDMATASEYGPQRPSCEFFLGLAAGLGIKITIPDTADLLKTQFLYGFEEREQTLWEKKITAMIQSIEFRKNKAFNQMNMSTKQHDQYIGALEALRESERVWSNHATPKTWNDPV